MQDVVITLNLHISSEEEGRVVEEIPRGRPSVDLWSENKELSETVEDLRKGEIFTTFTLSQIFTFY